MTEGTQAAPRPGVATPEEQARRLLEEAFRLSEEGRVRVAVEACQQALALNPNSASAHSLLGTLYERQGDRDGAIREYERVLTLSPGSTVERRRLNELMGVPAAREEVGISPRTARLAVTGGFLVVALLLVGAILFTLQQGPRPTGRAVGRPGGRRAAEAVALAEPQAIVPAPGQLYASAGPFAPQPAAPPSLAWTAAQAPAQPGYQFGQWVAPGTYLLPAGGAERFRGLESPGGVRPRARAPAGPFAGAVPFSGRIAPRVATPRRQRSPGLVPVGARISPRLARNYYFQGDYRRAIETYHAYLYENPSSGPAAREELAWVYLEAGDYQRSSQEYLAARDQYRSDLERAHNLEAARHGLRTCDSALKALEIR